MNKISKLAKIDPSIKIGKGNVIGDNVIIHKNVIIGDNNNIYNDTIIYPNTIIGDNNTILNHNIIGEHAVEANENFSGKKFNGLIIGNNNYFHTKNIVSNGYHNKTIIGDNNKILSDVYISHDVHIADNVYLYPRVFIAGLCTLLPYSGMGAGSYLHQNLVLGSYSFTGMANPVTKNIFPFFINVNGKYLKFNTKRVPNAMQIEKYSNDLLNIVDKLKNGDGNKELLDGNLLKELPNSIKTEVKLFLKTVTVLKI